LWRKRLQIVFPWTIVDSWDHAPQKCLPGPPPFLCTMPSKVSHHWPSNIKVLILHYLAWVYKAEDYYYYLFRYVYLFLNILPWILCGTLICRILIANEAAANLPHCLGGSLCVEAVIQSRGILCLKSFIINCKHRKWMDSSFLRSCGSRWEQISSGINCNSESWGEIKNLTNQIILKTFSNEKQTFLKKSTL